MLQNSRDKPWIPLLILFHACHLWPFFCVQGSSCLYRIAFWIWFCKLLWKSILGSLGRVSCVRRCIWWTGLADRAPGFRRGLDCLIWRRGGTFGRIRSLDSGCSLWWWLGLEELSRWPPDVWQAAAWQCYLFEYSHHFSIHPWNFKPPAFHHQLGNSTAYQGPHYSLILTYQSSIYSHPS